MVEFLLPKQVVVGSNPIIRSMKENTLDLLPLTLMVVVQVLHLYVSFVILKMMLEGIPWRVFGGL